MTDHVARMVDGWLAKTKGSALERSEVSSLVDSIHRLIREAEHETRQRCAELALRAGAGEAARLATAIRSVRAPSDESA